LDETAKTLLGILAVFGYGSGGSGTVTIEGMENGVGLLPGESGSGSD